MIDTFFMMLKRGMIAVVFVIFGFTMTYIPLPSQGGYVNVNQVHAGGVVVEVGANLVQNIYTAVQSTIQTVYKAWIYLKENVLDGIAWTIAKQFISNMVADIVDWINSGFDGNPAFVQDLGNFLLRSADEAVGQYINELGGVGSFVCAPFRLDVQLAVALQYDLNRENRVPECTLTTIITNFEDFIDGDFNAGGWEGWFDLVSQPQSTPYGSILAAQTQTGIRVAGAKNEELSLLDFGSGFISIPYCTSVPGPSGPIEECSIVKPGDVIRDTLNKSLGSGQDSLVEADEFNEIIVALLGQLTTRVVEGAQGILGLSGGSGYSYSGYSRGSFVDDLRDGVIDEGIGGGTTGDTVGDVVSGGVDSGLALIRTALTNQSAILGSIDTYIGDLNAFIANPRNAATDRVTAEIFRDDAINVRTRVADDIAEATPILSAYTTLDAEYAGATTERRAEIRTEQASLLEQFNNIGLMGEQEYEVNTNLWDRLLARDVPPPILGRPGLGATTTPGSPGYIAP